MKEFDFTPEASTGDLTGYVLMPRELANLAVWKKRPFSAGQAVADLYMLANTEAGEFRPKKGGTCEYKAGWVLWSNRGLAERWGWRKDDIEAFMRKLECAEIIRRHATAQDWKAVELADYRPVWDAAGTPAGHTWDADGTRTGTEGVGSGEIGEGEGVIRDGSSRAKPGVPVRRLNPNVAAIQTQRRREELARAVRDLEDDLHQARVTNMPRDAEKSARLKKLRAELTELEVAA